jgi:hypothetical protein
MTWVATAVVLIGAAVTTYNTIETQKRQDDQAVAGIQQQTRRQREADARVDQSVKELEQSSAQDARRQALQSYDAALNANKRSSVVGLPEGVGSDAFKQDSAAANESVKQYGKTNAGLMATMEGAGTQRMREGFGYGRLGTDLNLIGRQAAGDDFINSLKLKGIQRNPWLDFAGGVMTVAGGSFAGGGGVNSDPNAFNGPNAKANPTPNKNYSKGP